MAVLTVQVLQARGMPESKYSLWLKCGSEKKTTRVLSSNNPKWNETFTFPLESASEGWDLRVSLYDNAVAAVRLSRLHLREADLMGGTAPLWHAFEKPLANGSTAQIQLQIMKSGDSARAAAPPANRISPVPSAASMPTTSGSSSANGSEIKSQGSSSSLPQTAPAGPGLSSSALAHSKSKKKDEKDKEKREKKHSKEKLRHSHPATSQPSPPGSPPAAKGSPPEKRDSALTSSTTTATAAAASASSSISNSTINNRTEDSNVVVETRKQPAETLLVPQLTQKFKSLGPSTLTHSWEIDAKELEFVRELGEGTSAKVFQGQYRGQEVAIKVLKDRITDARILSDWAAEFNIMSMIRSPHVVFFYGATLKPMLAIVLELCQKGSLFDAMSSSAEKDSFTWARILKLTEGALKGLVCLHGWKPQLVHRDMKSLNLLVDDNWNVKVGDFGLSRVTEGTTGMSTLGKLRGTYAYCAPEVYFGQPYSPKADIYSMGVVFWELVARCITCEYQQPYAEYPKLMFPFQIIVQTAKNGLRPTLPDNTPAAVVDLLQRSWHEKPDDRPTGAEFIERVRALMKEYEANREVWDRLIAQKPYSLRDRALESAGKSAAAGGSSGLVHPPSFYE